MNSLELLSIFARGPKVYFPTQYGSETFLARDENFKYRINCRTRRAINMTIRNIETNNSYSAQFKIIHNFNDLTYAIDRIYDEMDCAVMCGDDQVNLEEHLTRLNGYLARTNGSIASNLQLSDNHLEAINFLQIVSGHNFSWSLDLSGPVKIQCWCPRCALIPLWIGWQLPQPLDTIPIGLVFPPWKDRRNIIRPRLNFHFVPAPTDGGVISNLKALSKINSGQFGNVQHLEIFASLLSEAK